jgi:ATP-dependent Clp protease ATP-binding subunit ClpA
MPTRYSYATYSIIHHARTEAEALGVPNGLSTKHLLLAIFHDRQSKAVLTLELLGLTADRIRATVELLAEQKDEPPLPVTTDPPLPEKALAELDDSFKAKWGSIDPVPGKVWQDHYRAKRALELEGRHHAREAVNAAYGFSRTLGDSDVAEPHHLLLALIHEEGGLASRVFAHLDLTYTEVFHALKGSLGDVPAGAAAVALKKETVSEDRIPRANERSKDQAIRDHCSPAAVKIVRQAQEAAAALGCPNGLSSKHLLLAILKDERSRSVRALESLGASPDLIRAAIVAEAKREDEPPVPEEPDEETQHALEDLRKSYFGNRDPDPKIWREQMREYFRAKWELYPTRANPAREALQRAYGLARNLGDCDVVQPHHLLLALMRDRACLAGRVFEHLNISYHQLLSALKDAP